MSAFGRRLLNGDLERARAHTKLEIDSRLGSTAALARAGQAPSKQ